MLANAQGSDTPAPTLLAWEVAFLHSEVSKAIAAGAALCERCLDSEREARAAASGGAVLRFCHRAARGRPWQGTTLVLHLTLSFFLYLGSY